jgi:peptidoglycan/xylan/chitin deacetylase (PgdA/CDA1 family)
MATKPLGSLSVDLDDLWSYLKTHGDPGWERRPSYLPTLVPRFLDLLDQAKLSVTFFLVGVDAAMARNRELLREITARGHEIGNHSHEHEPWLHRYSPDRLEAEVRTAEEAIVEATGARPRGFRGPGYSWSPELFRVLLDRGYAYDASTLPTYVGPLARAYYFRTTRLSAAQRAERRWLFGEFSHGFRPIKPYRWRLADGRELLEIPVTTFPLVKTPFHFSYLLYLAGRSPALARSYLRLALHACRAAGSGVSFLLHPLDVLAADETPALRFFPGMNVPLQRKVDFLLEVLDILQAQVRLVPMGEHARELMGRSESGAPAHRPGAPPLRTVDAS